MSEDDNRNPVRGIMNGENSLPQSSDYTAPKTTPSEPASFSSTNNNFWHRSSSLVPHFFALNSSGPTCSMSLGQNLFGDDDTIFFGLNSEAKMHKQHLKALVNPALFQQYRMSQKKYFDITSVMTLALIYFTAGVTRFNLQNTGKSGPLFDVSFALFVLTVVTFFMFLIAQCIVCHTSKSNFNRRSYQISERCLMVWFGGRIADVLGLLGILAMGFHLIARVNAGQCRDITNIWLSQSCNPVANLRAIPHDEILLLYAIPLSAQIAFRGLSVEALMLSWSSVIFFVLYSIIRVEGWLQLWTILYSIIFIHISFEIERLMRVTFVQTRAMLAAERSKLIRDLQLEAEVNLTKLRNRHELEIVEVSAENERKLREKENFQLRSLMGNVAHDLKTPLHSIEADLEVLNVFISKIPKRLLERATAEFQSKGVGDCFDPQSVFDSLNATCKFMEMAINRSQDFMKASNNIALVPVLETFELKTALAMSVTCINHLQSARMIMLHPCDVSICSHIISDKHWLIENCLCLLSNAMKYSDDGVVDIRMELINTPFQDPMPPRPGLSLEKRRPSKFLLRTAAESYDTDTVSISIVPAAATEANSSETSKVRQMVQLSVEDTGIGISEESRKNLFQPFKQAQRMAGGTGLGLYSLSKRIEALGGAAGVKSRPDGKQGSMFWFTFPYRPDGEAAIADVHVETLGTGTGSEKAPVNVVDSIQPRRILIVDDSLSILKVTSRLLKMNGHTVETASNGSIGLKRLKEAYDTDDFDMVLSDLQMPVMDGVEATSRFRRFEAEQMARTDDGSGTSYVKKKRLLIVGMSANSDLQSKQEALNSGMDYFVTKPFAYKDLQPILLSNSTSFYGDLQ